MTFDPRLLPLGALVPGTDWVKRCVLGSGGMGVVLGVEKDPGIRGAMKVMHPELANRPEHVARFLQEARMMVALRHPNIVQVIDAGRFPDGNPFVVTEWLEGRTLRASLSKHSTGLPAIVAWEINRQLCTGLHRAHCHTVKEAPTPIVHRDVKPENIFLQKQELAEPGVKLLDFGVAQLMDGSDDLRSTAGTLAYMAPEQLRGERVTPRTDLYATTLVLYEMLTGRLPWDIDYSDFDQMISAHRSLAPIPPTRFAPWLPPQVEALVLRGLAKDPLERPASAQALAQELFELQFVDESRASFRRGVVNRTTQPSAAISAWEERERATLDVADGGPGPQSGRGAAHHGRAEGAAPRPWSPEPTKTEGGTSRSLLSARSHALRARRRNRLLARAALGAVVVLGLLEGALLLARSRRQPQAASAASLTAEASSFLDAGLPAEPVASAVRAPSADSLAPAPAAEATPSPSASPAPPPSAHRGDRPAASGGRAHNTMADEL
jgi:serine/threonine protein kinase